MDKCGRLARVTDALTLWLAIATLPGCATEADRMNRLTTRLAAPSCGVYGLLKPSSFDPPARDQAREQMARDLAAAVEAAPRGDPDRPWLRAAWWVDGQPERGLIISTAWSGQSGWRSQTIVAPRTGPPRIGAIAQMSTDRAALLDRRLAESCLWREPAYVGVMAPRGGDFVLKNYDIDPGLLFEAHLPGRDRLAYQSSALGLTGATAQLLLDETGRD